MVGSVTVTYVPAVQSVVNATVPFLFGMLIFLSVVAKLPNVVLRKSKSPYGTRKLVIPVCPIYPICISVN